MKHLLPEEREQREPKFWRERTRQRQDLATVAALVIDRIFEDPDVSTEELKALVRTFREEARMAPYQEHLAKTLIHEYGKRRKQITALRRQHPDDADLLQSANPILRRQRDPLFVQAVVRPLTIHFRIGENAYDRLLIRPSLKSGGFYQRSKQLYTYERVNRFHRVRNDGTLLHEEMHAMNDFLRKPIAHALGKSPFERPLPSLAIIGPQLQARGLVALHEQLMMLLHARGDSIKDELFAFSRESFRSGTISASLMRSSDQNGVYDFFEQDRLLLERAIMAAEVKTRIRERGLEMIHEDFPRMHKRLVEDGLDAMRFLLDGKRWSFMEAAFFLVDVPLERWSDEIRLLKQSEP